MNFTIHKYINSCFVLVSLLFLLSCSENSKESANLNDSESPENRLGRIEFNNSGSPEAQESFINGVLALHNFWYPVARESFRKAREIDPDFAMAYWGEAMSHNRTFWQRQDKEAALKVLNELSDSEEGRLKGNLSEVEKDFIRSLSILYGEEESKLKRDQAYLAFMEKMYYSYPENHEVAAFYALAMLGVLRDNQGNEATRMKCAAVAQRIIDENPNHPGALHYKIHALDDPLHAVLALDAAYKYAEVAPESNHALHMPSHIFVQLGMWNEVRRSNIEARQASEKWILRDSLPLTYLDNHSLSWLAYAYTQMGLFDSADSKLKIAQINNLDTFSRGSKHYELDMLCRNWVESPEDGGDFPENFEGLDILSEMDKCKFEFTKGWNHLENDKQFLCMKSIDRMKEVISGIDSSDFFKHRTCNIYLNSLQGLLFFVRGKHDLADIFFEKAVKLEESLNPPTGPPDVIKPVHELYAEILLKRREYHKASELFTIALDRTPNRSMSRLGLARAYRLIGETARAKYQYEKLSENYDKVRESAYMNEALTFIRNNENVDAVAQLAEAPELNYDEKLKITQCLPLN
jgi:tetratricopeptide (TPR) repeat protein